MEAWKNALNRFLTPWKAKPKVIGALLHGSYATGHQTELSDIDVHMIIRESADGVGNGGKSVDGFRVEYFVMKPSGVRQRFCHDHQQNSHVAVTQFLTGRILFDNDGEIRRLKAEAETWRAKTFDRPDGSWIENHRRGLWKQAGSLCRSSADRPDLAHAYHVALRKVFNAYAQYRGAATWDEHRTYRFLTDESYRKRHGEDEFPDSEFAREFVCAVSEKDVSKMLPHVMRVTKHALTRMGGFSAEDEERWQTLSVEARRHDAG